MESSWIARCPPGSLGNGGEEGGRSGFDMKGLPKWKGVAMTMERKKVVVDVREVSAGWQEGTTKSWAVRLAGQLAKVVEKCL